MTPPDPSPAQFQERPPSGDGASLRCEWAVLAAVLRRGRMLDAWSSALLALAGLLALAAWWVPALWPVSAGPLWQALWAASVAAGLVQRYFAVRVAIDADVFGWLAVHGPAPADAARQIDHALHALGMRSAPPGPPCGWPERHAGALRLLRHQATGLLAQLLLLVVAVVLARH